MAFNIKHSSEFEGFEPLRFGAYEELAEELSKEKLIEVLIKEAKNYAKERKHDVGIFILIIIA